MIHRYKVFMSRGFHFQFNAVCVIHLNSGIDESHELFRPINDRAFTLIILHLSARFWLEDGKWAKAPFGRFALSLRLLIFHFLCVH